MINKTRKGNYYSLKTRKWMIKEGYTVASLEKSGRFIKEKDVFGADIVAMNKNQIIFIQVKSNKVDISKGVKELQRFPYPKFVDRWVVLWESRAKEPSIREVK